MTDPFEHLDAKDGYHVVLSESPLQVSIVCMLYSGGQLFVADGESDDDAVADVLRHDDPTPEQRGSATRLYLVLDAIARFLTTGGKWSELESAARHMRKKAAGNLVFPGYHLVDSYSTDEGTYQHVFAKDDGSGKAVLWEEPEVNASGGLVGGLIDRTTLEAIKKAQDDDGWRKIEATAQSGSDLEGADPLQLRAGRDPEEEDAAEDRNPL